MTARLFLLFPFSLLFITQLCSQIESTFETDSITRILYNYAEDDVPGIAVGVVKDGAILYENYIGYANLTHRIKVSEKTRFNIASTAKQFTALMILQLSIEGKLSLEDDIRKYLPTLYPKVKEDIKIRHLLNHSSGIRDYVELLSLKGEIWWKQMGLDNDDILELIAQQEDLGFDPGSQYAYSNTGYVLLAKIVEAVTDEKFTDYSKNFFQQIDMKETSFVERYMGIIPNRAEPYYDWGNGKWMRTPT
ncbi:MAG: serine hydrolase domain-containing protein, partial [Bacteroidota bacterium]